MFLVHHSARGQLQNTCPVLSWSWVYLSRGFGMGQEFDRRDADAHLDATRARLLLAHRSLADALSESAPRDGRDAAIHEWERAISEYVDSLAPRRIVRAV
jgi:hypothetical protein